MNKLLATAIVSVFMVTAESQADLNGYTPAKVNMPTKAPAVHITTKPVASTPTRFQKFKGTAGQVGGALQSSGIIEKLKAMEERKRAAAEARKEKKKEKARELAEQRKAMQQQKVDEAKARMQNQPQATGQGPDLNGYGR